VVFETVSSYHSLWNRRKSSPTDCRRYLPIQWLGPAHITDETAASGDSTHPPGGSSRVAIGVSAPVPLPTPDRNNYR